MAEIKLSDIPKLIKVTVDTMQSKKTLNELGEELAERIVRRTRLGKGVQKNLGKATALKPLAPSTKAERRRLKKTGELTGPRATPAKSGLNRTGQMLNSVKHKAKKGELEIILNNQEAKEKAQTLADQDRRFIFMNVSQAEFKGLFRSLNDILSDTIKKVFK